MTTSILLSITGFTLFHFFILLGVSAVAIAVGVTLLNRRNKQEQEAMKRRQRRRARGATAGMRKKRQRQRQRQDFFALDMSKYDAPPQNGPVDVPAAAYSVAEELRQPSAGASAAKRRPEVEFTHSHGRSPHSQVNRKKSLPPAMVRVMNVLKSNRRYEFGELAGSQSRMGAPCMGGLFAEVHFGRSEDGTVIPGLLNPD
jgi:hypothetical protein